MKQVPVKLGPLALLLTIISICLTVLAILNYATARADMRLAEKYAETVQTRYELESRGQHLLSELGGTDPGDWELIGLERDAEGVYRTALELDGTQLHIGVKPGAAGQCRVVCWRMEKQWAEDDTIGNLWNGF